MAATLLSVFAGGEASALAAKTTHHAVAKITHVKVTKHKVSGYTTPESHIKLMKLKHGEKASATANHKGKFVIKVKNNNLSKLKFKIKATKHGLKARTHVHKVKKAAQSIDSGNTGSQATPTPAPTTPDSSSESKKPEKPVKPNTGNHNNGGNIQTVAPSLAKQAENLKKEFNDAQAALTTLNTTQKSKRDSPKIKALIDAQNALNAAKTVVDNAGTSATETQKETLATAQTTFDNLKKANKQEYSQLKQLDSEKETAQKRVDNITQQLQALTNLLKPVPAP